MKMLVHDAMLMHDAKTALMLAALNSAGGDAGDACVCDDAVDNAMLCAEARGNSSTGC